MKNKSAQKVRLASYDDLFGTDEKAGETITSVALEQLRTFRGHPFRVLDDEKMQETVDSVKKYGILIPGIVRPHPESGYEVIAGHRRWRACEIAGLKEMPVIIREMDDDAAVVAMVDSNIQREDILPSEKARAYRMKYEAMKHQGSKGDKHTADAIGEVAGESGRTVQRYIRLSALTQGLMDLVDGEKIPMAAGEQLSYLKEEEQTWVVDAISNSGISPTKAQAEQLRAASGAGGLTEGGVYALLVKKGRENVNVTISAKRIRDYFPDSYSKEQIEGIIYTLLEDWKQKEGGTADAGATV